MKLMGTPAKKIQETSKKADYVPLYIPPLGPDAPTPKTAAELHKRVTHYLQWCKDHEVPPVLRGLPMAAGLLPEEYEAIEKKEYVRIPPEEREKLAWTAKMFKEAVKHNIDLRLLQGLGGSGTIFLAKNSMHYSDNYQIHSKIEYDVSPQLQQLASQIVSKLPAPPSALPGQPPEIVVQPTQEPDSDD